VTSTETKSPQLFGSPNTLTFCCNTVLSNMSRHPTITTILVRNKVQNIDLVYCDVLRDLESSHYENSNPISGWKQKLYEYLLWKLNYRSKASHIKCCCCKQVTENSTLHSPSYRKFLWPRNSEIVNNRSELVKLAQTVTLLIFTIRMVSSSNLCLDTENPAWRSFVIFQSLSSQLPG
jgi:hypothetical protein